MVFFQVKKSHCAGIRWPGHSVWIAGLDGKGITGTTYARVIEPWLRQAPGPCIGAIALSDDPCAMVQPVEPLLIDNRVRTIIAAESALSQCPDFISFVREYGVQCSAAVPRCAFSPSPGCSLVIEAGAAGEEPGMFRRFLVKMENASIRFGDFLDAPSETRGAATVTFGTSGSPRVTYAIPLWHPLVAAMHDEKGAAGIQ